MRVDTKSKRTAVLLLVAIRHVRTVYGENKRRALKSKRVDDAGLSDNAQLRQAVIVSVGHKLIPNTPVRILIPGSQQKENGLGDRTACLKRLSNPDIYVDRLTVPEVSRVFQIYVVA